MFAISPQPTIVVNTDPPLYQPPPASRSTFTYGRSRGLSLQLHTPAVSTSDANSSRLPQSFETFETFTDGTAFSDQMSTGLESFGSYAPMNSSGALIEFPADMTMPVAQQTTVNMGYNPVPGFAVASEEPAPDHWTNILHDPQYQAHSVGEYLPQDGMQPGEYDEKRMPSMAP